MWLYRGSLSIFMYDLTVNVCWGEIAIGVVMMIVSTKCSRQTVFDDGYTSASVTNDSYH